MGTLFHEITAVPRKPLGPTGEIALQKNAVVMHASRDAAPNFGDNRARFPFAMLLGDTR